MGAVLSEPVSYEPSQTRRRDGARWAANAILLYPLLVLPLHLEYQMLLHGVVTGPPYASWVLTFDRVVGLCLVSLIPGALFSFMLTFIHVSVNAPSPREITVRTLFITTLLVGLYALVTYDPGGVLAWYLNEKMPDSSTTAAGVE